MLINPYSYVTAGGGSGFPSVSDADTTTGTQSSSAATWTINYPANIAAGDLILLTLAHSAWAWETASISSFTRLLGRTASATPPSHFAFGKVAAGGESGTFTIGFDTAGTGVWRVIRITAASWFGGSLVTGQFSTASDGVSGIWTSGTGSAPDPSSRTPAWGSAKTLWLVLAAHKDATTTISAFSASYGSTAQQQGGAMGIGIQRRELEAASDDPGALTLSASEEWSTMTIAIRPS